uniref:Uncharacterized protein n=1 Tax=Rhizophora mucronata TaxID=61149 RepID=A0A2P2KJ82_RHIMU
MSIFDHFFSKGSGDHIYWCKLTVKRSY